jgi:hypothetical protein
MGCEKLAAGFGKHIEIPPDVHVAHQVQIFRGYGFTMINGQCLQQSQRYQTTALPVPDAAFKLIILCCHSFLLSLFPNFNAHIGE